MNVEPTALRRLAISFALPLSLGKPASNNSQAKAQVLIERHVAKICLAVAGWRTSRSSNCAASTCQSPCRRSEPKVRCTVSSASRQGIFSFLLLCDNGSFSGKHGAQVRWAPLLFWILKSSDVNFVRSNLLKLETNSLRWHLSLSLFSNEMILFHRYQKLDGF